MNWYQFAGPGEKFTGCRNIRSTVYAVAEKAADITKDI